MFETPGESSARRDLASVAQGGSADYRTLAGAFLLAAVDVERTIEYVLASWFVDARDGLMTQFSVAILQGKMLGAKVKMLRAAIGELAHDPDVKDVLDTVSGVIELRNRIAHQRPKIWSNRVEFRDGTPLTLSLDEFRRRLDAAERLPMRLVDVFEAPLARQRRNRSRGINDLQLAALQRLTEMNQEYPATE